MLEYKGKYTKANVMIDIIDEETVSQIYRMINHEVFTNPVVIMPDTHKGNGSVIGFTMEISDKIIPNVVGVDIGCGMLAENYGKDLLKKNNLNELDIKIRTSIPFGPNIHVNKNCRFWNKNIYDSFFNEVNKKIMLMTTKYNNKFKTNYTPSFINEHWLQKLCDIIEIDFYRVINSLGTLGGGNHFIELGKSENTGDYWFTVHTGSRQFGLKICNYWQQQGGKEEMAYIEGEDMYKYFICMIVAQIYAETNRDIIQTLISETMENSQVSQSITSTHNFIDFDDFIIRKGAIRSYKNEKMVIPLNMEDGILLCEGNSNPNWNFSAPHGAGRVGSRSWAKKNLSIDKAKYNMNQKNIYASKIPHDEIKEAYKDPKIIEEVIDPTAKIVDRIIPVLAIKD